MKIRPFVSVCSLLLSLWLGATFFQKVPSHRYPQLGKDAKKATAAAKAKQDSIAANPKTEPAEVQTH